MESGAADPERVDPERVDPERWEPTPLSDEEAAELEQALRPERGMFGRMRRRLAVGLLVASVLLMPLSAGCLVSSHAWARLYMISWGAPLSWLDWFALPSLAWCLTLVLAGGETRGRTRLLIAGASLLGGGALAAILLQTLASFPLRYSRPDESPAASVVLFAMGLGLAVLARAQARPDAERWVSLLVGVLLLVMARASLILDGLVRYTPEPSVTVCGAQWNAWARFQGHSLAAGVMGVVALALLVKLASPRRLPDQTPHSSARKASFDMLLLAPLALVLTIAALGDTLTALTTLSGWLGAVGPLGSPPAAWTVFANQALAWATPLAFVAAGGCAAFGVSRAPSHGARPMVALAVVATLCALFSVRATASMQSRAFRVGEPAVVFDLAAPPGVLDRRAALCTARARRAAMEERNAPNCLVLESAPRSGWGRGIVRRCAWDAAFLAVGVVLGGCLVVFARRRKAGLERAAKDPYRTPGATTAEEPMPRGQRARSAAWTLLVVLVAAALSVAAIELGVDIR